MSHFKLLPLVALFLITTYPNIAQACSCWPTELQDDYCDSQVVIRITVVSGEEVVIRDSDKNVRVATQEEIDNDLDYQGSMYKRYKYKIRQLVRGKKPKTKYVYTNYHSNLCGGSSLEMDKYVIMGSTLETNKKSSLAYRSCDFVREWDTLSEEEQTIIRRRQYKHVCAR